MHRVCDRPAAIVRLLEEVSAAGAEQVIVVTSDVAIVRPHALRARAVEPLARLADYIAGAEASSARDALTALDLVRPTDPQKADADRLRGEIQLQLIALTSVPAQPVAGKDASRPNGDRPVP